MCSIGGVLLLYWNFHSLSPFIEVTLELCKLKSNSIIWSNGERNWHGVISPITRHGKKREDRAWLYRYKFLTLFYLLWVGWFLDVFWAIYWVMWIEAKFCPYIFVKVKTTSFCLIQTSSFEDMIWQLLAIYKLFTVSSTCSMVVKVSSQTSNNIGGPFYTSDFWPILHAPHERKW